ncbi:hypothetical protein F0919_09135 [Taibaiella lutea]|uniref:Uncharacterized protein n=2 Tax=Taibaiella lutea TaxID=2608001 RepID=A0A5M6CL97_9BACT|nr:hypothetical protein F0919_09135 [Taibaiella lutea]
MMIQALDKQILAYLPLLGTEEKESLISVIKSFLHLKEEASLGISIEQYNKELDEAEAAFERGEFINNEEMLKEIRKW